MLRHLEFFQRVERRRAVILYMKLHLLALWSRIRKKGEINPVSNSATGGGCLKHSKGKNKGKAKGKRDCWVFHQFLDEVAGRTSPSVGSSSAPLVLSEVSRCALEFIWTSAGQTSQEDCDRILFPNLQARWCRIGLVGFFPHGVKVRDWRIHTGSTLGLGCGLVPRLTSFPSKRTLRRWTACPSGKKT